MTVIGYRELQRIKVEELKKRLGGGVVYVTVDGQVRFKIKQVDSQDSDSQGKEDTDAV